MTEKEKLIEMIQNSDKIKRYKRLEALMNNNDEIKGRIQDLKKLQQQMINAKEMEKPRAYKDFKIRYDTLKKEIEEYPLMAEYFSLQAEINGAIQHIIEAIEQEINDQLRL